MSSNHDHEDTEILIALVASILEPQISDTTAIINALVKHDGDAEAAANFLKKTQPKPAETATSTIARKRKRNDDGAASLDTWLNQAKPSSSRLKTPEPTHPRAQDSPKGDIPNSNGVLRVHAPASSPSKKPVDLMKILRDPSTNSRSPSKPTKPQSTSKSNSHSITRQPPLTLPSPALVSAHTPCTLHFSVLPPELACRLFHTMRAAAHGWQRNRWWLFDRMVESPHKTSFFVRRDLDAEYSNGNDIKDTERVSNEERWSEAARFWYNGKITDPPPTFPDAMEEACHIIEQLVNQEMRKRPACPLEWRPPSEGPESDPSRQTSADKPIWRANVAASNCYEGGKESVGWHSDQLTYLGPYPTIASLSLGTRRTFSLREVIPSNESEERKARTFNIPLPHNSLIIMHASAQERFKHSIPPQAAVDIYKPLFPAPSSTPPAPKTTSTVAAASTFLGRKPDNQTADEQHSFPRHDIPLPLGHHDHTTTNGSGSSTLLSQATRPQADTSTIMIEPRKGRILGNQQLNCHDEFRVGQDSADNPDEADHPAGELLDELGNYDERTDTDYERTKVDDARRPSDRSSSSSRPDDRPSGRLASMPEEHRIPQHAEPNLSTPSTATSPKPTGPTNTDDMVSPGQGCGAPKGTYRRGAAAGAAVAEGSNVRINITFRFYRPDFRPDSIPRCKCGVPTILRPDMKGTLRSRPQDHAVSGHPKNSDQVTAKYKATDPGSRRSSAVSAVNGALAERTDQEEPMKYWWTCFAHAQNDGKGCGYWRVMDMEAEGRGWRDGL
ncbi:hypothetical protein HGRIS_013504 [Hohenbuehelia grisea]|uniref:Alpha-ketoglutarate-dependent dioxygenase AlkB-like domain-containing protein n=1 Tax=Hohenbuehelia grisea TaxID=104357 RepID=A0ABR3IVL1_9AGAR